MLKKVDGLNWKEIREQISIHIFLTHQLM
jgi:hypothetical protein